MNNAIVPNTQPKVKSKKAKILAHLQSGKSLTQWECTHLYRSTRLAAIVHQLRGQGYDIVTINCKNANDNGTHAKYVMRGASLA